MAVTRINELHQKRRSAFRDGKLTNTRAFQVKCSVASDGPDVALHAKIMDGQIVVAAVPIAGEPFPNRAGLKMVGKDAQPVSDSDTLFEVTCEYAVPDKKEEEQWIEPLARPAEISWNPSEGTEPYFLDKSSTPKAVVNAAGEPFENFMERECGELVISITRNEATHNAVTADTYSHTTNAAVVNIDGTAYAAGTLKMSPITAQKVQEARPDGTTATFYRRSYSIKARRQGWDDVLMNVGFNELSGSTLKPIVDSAGLPVRKPYPLQTNGTKATSPTTTPSTITFKPYESKSWTSLGLS